MADAGRVIAGTAKGVRLDAPGPGTRPLADRVKQTLFAILEPDLEGAVVADLFAGSGAGGIEALSRGASRAVFVERHAATSRVITANLRRAGLEANARVVTRDALAWLSDPAGAAVDGPFDLVLIDPPYEDTAALRRSLELVGPHVAPGGHRRRQALLAGRPAGRDRAASIRAGAPLRGDGAHLLPASAGGRRGVNVAVYPGSFDPITNGHLDVIARAARVFDRVVVAVLGNPRKSPLLAADERVAIIGEAVAADPRLAGRVEVRTFDGLTVEFCHEVGAGFLVRGLRAIADFETELQLAHNNHQLAPDVDTVFFMTSLQHSYISSSLVKEIALFGGDVSAMVPAQAAAALRRAMPSRQG